MQETIVKFLTTKNTEKTLNVDRKRTHYIQKNNNSNTADLSLEIMNVTRCGNTSLKYGGMGISARIKISFKNGDEIHFQIK